MEKHKELLRHNIRQYGMLFALIAIVLIFQILTGGILLRPINVTRLILQNSYILILAVGMMLCILTGGHIDLSVGSIVAMVGASSALFSVRMGLPAPLSIFLGLLVGLLAGMWQGSGLPLSKSALHSNSGGNAYIQRYKQHYSKWANSVITEIIHNYCFGQYS